MLYGYMEPSGLSLGSNLKETTGGEFTVYGCYKASGLGFRVQKQPLSL